MSPLKSNILLFQMTTIHAHQTLALRYVVAIPHQTQTSATSLSTYITSHESAPHLPHPTLYTHQIITSTNTLKTVDERSDRERHSHTLKYTNSRDGSANKDIYQVPNAPT